MSMIQNLVRGIATRAMKYAGVPMRDPALAELFGFNDTQAGVHVDEETSLSLSAYYSGIQLISFTVGMMELQFGRVENGTFLQTAKHPINSLLSTCVNDVMTPFDFKSFMQEQIISWGDGYSFIERDGGHVVALHPVHHKKVTPFYDDRTLEKKYSVDSGADGGVEVYDSFDMLQIPGFGYDGLCGRSVVQCARESLGIGIATDRQAASSFGNTTLPGSVVTHPQSLTDKARKNLEKDLEDRLRGPYRSRRILLLEEGMTIAAGIPNDDAQFLENRAFQVREIARWLRVPPHLLYDLEGATFSNIENMGLEFLIYSLSPWLTRWVEHLRIALLSPTEIANGFTFRWNTDSLRALDSTARWANYREARNLGVYTLNDIMRREGMPLLESVIGDTHIAPSTMKILERDDPTAPISPDIVSGALAVFDGMNSVPLQTAKNVLNGMMPTATDKFIDSLCVVLKSKRVVA